MIHLDQPTTFARRHARRLPAMLTSAVIATALATMMTQAQEPSMQQDHPYVGMWVTADGNIRQELLANGRYEEARGNREKAYQGRYEISGNLIQYWDDTGFTADGEFRDDVLYHAGMVMYRQPAD